MSSSDPDPACPSLTQAMNPCATWSQLWLLLGPILVHSSFFMAICKAAGHRTTRYCPAMCTQVFRQGQAGAGVSMGFMDGAYPQGPALFREGQGPASQQTWCPHPHLRDLNTLVKTSGGPRASLWVLSGPQVAVLGDCSSRVLGVPSPSALFHARI